MPMTITIPASELFDEENDEFLYTKEQTLVLEHSLVSISKWETKWKKPYLSETPKSNEEALDYIRCMTITQNVDPNVYRALTNEHISKITDYIKESQTATTVKPNSNGHRARHSGKFVTSELIYFWMTAFNIPFTCEKWNFSRLMALIEIAGEENNPDKKKMGRGETLAQNRALNAQRRARLKSKG